MVDPVDWDFPLVSGVSGGIFYQAKRQLATRKPRRFYGVFIYVCKFCVFMLRLQGAKELV